ncbi:MAG: DsbC family protein [Rhodoferax sp.]|nr:DsbC family protein [Rhodoferax sp.]
MNTKPCKALLGGVLALLGASAMAQEAVIRKNLPERLPQLKTIDEITKTGIPGLFEIRVNGSDIFYTDSQANYLIMGNLIDTQAKRNLTEERLEKLSAVKFDDLPFKDAFTIVRGTGKRKLAVFEDPNCGYCKRFERDLQKLDNVTVYMFLYPILGPDSAERSKAIWCAKEPAKAWQDWMLRDKQPSSAAAGCDSTALARNVDLGRNYRINGTPTIILSNGQRIPGAVDDKQLEKALAEVKG